MRSPGESRAHLENHAPFVVGELAAALLTAPQAVALVHQLLVAHVRRARLKERKNPP